MIDFVAVGALPRGEGAQADYLSQWRAEFPEADLLVPTTFWSQEVEILAMSYVVEHFGVTLVAVDEETAQYDVMNSVMGQAKSGNCLLLTAVLWPEPGLKTQLEGEDFDSDSEALTFDVRLSDENRVQPWYGQTLAIPPLAILISQQAFLRIRGFDNRPGIKDAAVLDLATRLSCIGYLVRGSEDHGFFLSTGTTDAAQWHEDIRCAQAFRDAKAISDLQGDKSIFRNLDKRLVETYSAAPLVTVAISTHNRADLLAECIHSVMAQTFQDFEIIVVDDASEDEAAVRKTIRDVGDERIRLIRFDEQQGVSAARNRAADEARGYLTAVHDDDDLMLPDRLELGIAALTHQCNASYGGWINFDHLTGALHPHITKNSFGSALNSFNGQGPGHSTWTLPTDLLKLARYDEVLPGSVDHNLASRLAWVGVKWAHVGHFMYLRRVHPRQITSVRAGGQKYAHQLTRTLNNFAAPPQDRENSAVKGKKLTYPSLPGKDSLFKTFGAYLPDSLVHRRVRILGNVANSLFKAEVPDKASSIVEERDLVSGKKLLELGYLNDVSYQDLVNFRLNGFTNWRFESVEPILSTHVADQAGGGEETIECADSPLRSGADWEELESSGLSAITVEVESLLVGRVDATLREFRKSYPEGSLVLRVADGNQLPISADPVEGALLSRHLIVAGEFGVAQTAHIFGFGNAQAAIEGVQKVAEYPSEFGIWVYPFTPAHEL